MLTPTGIWYIELTTVLYGIRYLMFPFLHKVGQEHPEELGFALAYVIAPQLIKGVINSCDKLRTKEKKFKKFNLSATDTYQTIQM